MALIGRLAGASYANGWTVQTVELWRGQRGSYDQRLSIGISEKKSMVTCVTPDSVAENSESDHGLGSRSHTDSD